MLSSRCQDTVPRGARVAPVAVCVLLLVSAALWGTSAPLEAQEPVQTPAQPGESKVVPVPPPQEPVQEPSSESIVFDGASLSEALGVTAKLRGLNILISPELKDWRMGPVHLGDVPATTVLNALMQASVRRVKGQQVEFPAWTEEDKGIVRVYLDHEPVVEMPPPVAGEPGSRNSLAFILRRDDEVFMGTQEYLLRRGDSVDRLALRIHEVARGSAASYPAIRTEILRLNPGLDPERLLVGQKVLLPVPNIRANGTGESPPEASRRGIAIGRAVGSIEELLQAALPRDNRDVIELVDSVLELRSAVRVARLKLRQSEARRESVDKIMRNGGVDAFESMKAANAVAELEVQLESLKRRLQVREALLKSERQASQLAMEALRKSLQDNGALKAPKSARGLGAQALLKRIEGRIEALNSGR